VSTGHRCENCGDPKHFARECPTRKQSKPKQSNQGLGPKPNKQGKKQKIQFQKGKLNFTSEANIIEGAPVMMSTFSIRDKPIKILFDSGATNSFFNGKTREKLRLEDYSINKTYKINTPGSEVVSNRITRKVPLVTDSKTIHSNLIILDLEGIGIILGMDWISRHNIILDIFERMEEINSPIVGATTLYLPF
jgi:hypothetical protein